MNQWNWNNGTKEQRYNETMEQWNNRTIEQWKMEKWKNVTL